jgi:hypothetical protein
MLTVGSDRPKIQPSIIPCRVYGDGTILVSVCSYHHGEIHVDTKEDIEKDAEKNLGEDTEKSAKEVPKEDPKSLAAWLRSHHGAINSEILKHYAENNDRKGPIFEVKGSKPSISRAQTDDLESGSSVMEASNDPGSSVCTTGPPPRYLPDGRRRSGVTKLTEDSLSNLRKTDSVSMFSSTDGSSASTAMTARRE